MLGQINKRKKLEETFADYPSIAEIYSDKDFTFEKDTACFYCLFLDTRNDSKNIDIVKMLMDIRYIFSDDSRLYFAKSGQDIMLLGKKLIWRKGRWYI
jgi:hypothetical protein